jgi:peptidoglycan/xylan/chitin deacetylase (PgdA/CDA1 family)
MLNWAEIEQLASQGATIGSHSASHPNFARISEAKAEEELYESRLAIASRIGISPTSFAIPMGQSHDWTPFAQETATRAGYRLVYAQAEDSRAEGTIPRTFITRYDNDRVFSAALAGVFDRWEEWV